MPSDSHGTSARSASAMARARTGSLPARSARRMTPSASGLRGAALARCQAHQFQRAAADIGQHAVGGGDAAQQAERRDSAASSVAGQDVDRHVRHARLQLVDEGGGRWCASRTAAVARISNGSAPMARATAW